MLDTTITELADRMIQLQFHERTKQLDHDILLAQNDASTRGLGTSSAVIELVYNLCARDIELRALIVWQNLVRVFSQSGAQLSEMLATDLKQAVSRYNEAIFAEPHSRLEKLVDNIRIGYRPSLTETRSRALDKVNAEIDLFVLGLNRGNESQSSQSGYVFNGPVGAVLTGPNSNANVFQTITQQDREALLAAVDLLKKGLASVDRLPAHPKEDIVELVQEAEVETRKSKPNNSRLLAIFMTVATAIQAVGSLKPAYDMLKTALIPFSVQLP